MQGGYFGRAEKYLKNKCAGKHLNNQLCRKVGRDEGDPRLWHLSISRVYRLLL